MTYFEAPKASFLVAEKFESQVNCWHDLTPVRGVGPFRKFGVILGVLSSQGREQGTSSGELGIERGIWH